MSEPVYVSVNVPNIVTILIIVGVGWGLFAAGASLLRQYLPGQS
jgi:hypothetical protein